MRITILMFALFAISANAQTAAELEQRIEDLESTLAALEENQAAYVFLNGTSGAPNVVTHPDYNSIDPLVYSSTISGGGGDRSNHIGLVGFDYEPGTAKHAVIAGGFDNINNQLAGTVSGGAHHRLSGSGDHGTVGGGGSHTILSGAYGTIGGGGFNHIRGGKGIVIAGGTDNTATNAFAVIAGGQENIVDGYAGVVSGGRYNQVSESATYGVVLGGRRSVSAAPYSVAFGESVIADVPASLSFSGRYNDNPGDAQAVQFHLSKVSYGDQVVSLAVIGARTMPVVPDNSAWAGKGYIIVRAANGAVASWNLPIVVGFDDGEGWTASGAAADAQLIVDQIGMAGDAISASVMPATGEFNMKVRGLSGNELHWSAFIVVSQVQ